MLDIVYFLTYGVAPVVGIKSCCKYELGWCGNIAHAKRTYGGEKAVVVSHAALGGGHGILLEPCHEVDSR